MWKIAFILTCLVAGQALADVQLSGIARVVDGDSLSLGPVAVRLNGIDAPEIDQSCTDAANRKWSCGVDAMNWLARKADGRQVQCDPLDRDAYGRVIARCMIGGQDLGQGLVKEGLAWAYRQYSTDYVADEDAAHAARIGIWSAQNQPPWEYRANRWERAAAASPRPGCPIKGNISRKGERIYHTPWSPYYSKTIIDENAGERWFCDEKEAVAAGWRAARWR